MIIDVLKNAALYKKLDRGLGRALDYLAKSELAMIEPGRYELDGDHLYVLVQRYETKPREAGIWEAHRRYVDVQYVAEGAESMGYAYLGCLKVTQEYAPDKDCVLLAGQGDFVTVRAGTFVVFFPEDAHMPGIACSVPAPVLKVVVKVRIG